MTKNLFVAGCPRSGTTVLTRLLNLHPEIVIGLERYKQLFGKNRRIKPEILAEENFFNFKPNETNFTPESSSEAALFYREAKRKFPHARFIGDKYPQFFRFYGKLFHSFPHAFVVFIVRNPLSVAQSWQRRAEDSTSWPEKNDARRSVTYWNDALAYTLAYAQIKPSAFIFLEYEELFRRKQQVLKALFSRIGADCSEDVLSQVSLAAEQEFERSEAILQRPMSLDGETVEAIRESADMLLYEQLKKLVAL